eukprot:CAMPEP_0176490462 /NCGR_PEP_ID=MMETSP0200_2-20121128/7883_1 /TAXON_ID=947934 /ORGANISM="Chaetoceros sp., Strain GSL56" /LENGTH=525 /DNA_ID=CAMNT_0017887769 /DNA_START=29 /DNA_END=1606 /DNA_ORIENTATION=-
MKMIKKKEHPGEDVVPPASHRKVSQDRKKKYSVVAGISVFTLVVMWYFNLWAMTVIMQNSAVQEGSNNLYSNFRFQIMEKAQTLDGSGQQSPMLVQETEPSGRRLTQPTNDQSAIASAAQKRSPYTYVWVIGGIREDRYGYKGFLWDVLISANLLRKLGSTADFCIFVRLSPSSNLDDLPWEDRQLLEALGIQIILLEKPQVESFSQLVFDKFLTINMTDYKRVMFLDADIVPITNLDYIFHLSDPDYTQVPTLLKPNMITASLGEPCNTGIFMVEPSKEGFEQYEKAFRQQRERAKTLPYPYFDKDEGWGHNFHEHGDSWQAVNKKSSKWIFHASHSDQGLMYYWAKYLRQNVTIFISDLVQNWKSGDNGQPIMESEGRGILAPYQGKVLFQQWSCDDPQRADESERRNSWRCVPFFEGFAHFVGKRKPWKSLWRPNHYTTSSHRRQSVKYLWFDELMELNEKYKMGLDMKHWDRKYPSLLRHESVGTISKYSEQVEIFGISETVGSDAEEEEEEGEEERKRKK